MAAQQQQDARTRKEKAVAKQQELAVSDTTARRRSALAARTAEGEPPTAEQWYRVKQEAAVLREEQHGATTGVTVHKGQILKALDRRDTTTASAAADDGGGSPQPRVLVRFGGKETFVRCRVVIRALNRIRVVVRRRLGGGACGGRVAGARALRRAARGQTAKARNRLG